MRSRGLSLIAVAVAAWASHAETQHMPRGTATDVSRAEVEAWVEKTASAAVSDQAVRVVGINAEYNVGVGVVDRAKTAATATGGSAESSQITEVGHVIEGRATLVTGGTIDNAREPTPDTTVVKVLNGPGKQEDVVQNGTSRQAGGGTWSLFANTPHWSSEIESPQIVYFVVRVDPPKVLPAGYGRSKSIQSNGGGKV